MSRISNFIIIVILVIIFIYVEIICNYGELILFLCGCFLDFCTFLCIAFFLIRIHTLLLLTRLIYLLMFCNKEKGNFLPICIP